MSWLRIDDGFDTHPKLLELTEQQRWRWTRVLIHCARHRTQGHVKTSVLRDLGLGRAIEKLLSIDLLEQNGESGYLVHDWHDYAPKDPTKAERQARWRAKQASTETRLVDEEVDEQIVHSRVDAPARPVLSSPKDQEPPPNHVAQDEGGRADLENGLDPDQDLATLLARATPDDIPF